MYFFVWTVYNRIFKVVCMVMECIRKEKRNESFRKIIITKSHTTVSIATFIKFFFSKLYHDDIDFSAHLQINSRTFSQKKSIEHLSGLNSFYYNAFNTFQSENDDLLLNT